MRQALPAYATRFSAAFLWLRPDHTDSIFNGHGNSERCRKRAEAFECPRGDVAFGQQRPPGLWPRQSETQLDRVYAQLHNLARRELHADDRAPPARPRFGL